MLGEKNTVLIKKACTLLYLLLLCCVLSTKNEKLLKRDIVCKNQIIFLLFDSDSHQIRCFPDILKETMDKKKGDEHFF